MIFIVLLSKFFVFFSAEHSANCYGLVSGLVTGSYGETGEMDFGLN